MIIEEDELISRRLKICENCEWCILTENMPKCLLKNDQIGLFEQCELFKQRTGMHISI